MLSEKGEEGEEMSGNGNVELLEGPITGALVKLSLPIMGTSLIQMAYHLTDMIWVGRLSSDAVAAVGVAGMYLWLSRGLAAFPRMGGQIRVGQCLGAGKKEEARRYARSAMQIGIFLGLLFGLICAAFSDPLIAFFGLTDPEVIQDAKWYLIITGGGVVFSFVNLVMTGIFISMGNTMATFRATLVGMVINLFLDPLLIFGIGPFPRLEVVGAALATLFAQIIVFLVFLVLAGKDPVIFRHLALTRKVEWDRIREITKIGTPVAVQQMIFTFISMGIARIISGWGEAAIAAQKVGSQVESISWMAAEGFSSAINAFTAQNYGADNRERVRQGYLSSVKLTLVWSVFTTFVLLVFPGPIFKIFIPEAEVLPIGVSYLRIMGYSQILMCLEITTGGAFQGLGRTMPSTVEGIVLTAARIPLAIGLASTALGLDGVWWSITISSIAKGIVLVSWFGIVLHRYVQRRIS